MGKSGPCRSIEAAEAAAVKKVARGSLFFRRRIKVDLTASRPVEGIITWAEFIIVEPLIFQTTAIVKKKLLGVGFVLIQLKLCSILGNIGDLRDEIDKFHRKGVRLLLVLADEDRLRVVFPDKTELLRQG